MFNIDLKRIYKNEPFDYILGKYDSNVIVKLKSKIMECDLSHNFDFIPFMKT